MVRHTRPLAEVQEVLGQLSRGEVSGRVVLRMREVHGGMGFTWENDLHLYYRRAKASETMLGDATFHRERIARLVIDAPGARPRDVKEFCGSAL